MLRSSISISSSSSSSNTTSHQLKRTNWPQRLLRAAAALLCACKRSNRARGTRLAAAGLHRGELQRDEQVADMEVDDRRDLVGRRVEHPAARGKFAAGGVVLHLHRRAPRPLPRSMRPCCLLGNSCADAQVLPATCAGAVRASPHAWPTQPAAGGSDRSPHLQRRVGGHAGEEDVAELVAAGHRVVVERQRAREVPALGARASRPARAPEGPLQQATCT
jgi:hypothetical protein